MSIDDVLNKLCNHEISKSEAKLLLTKKEKKLVFDIESTSFTIPNEHGNLYLKLPFGWSKMMHYKAGMKVSVKLIK
jgi:hypothetical protein